MPAYRKSISLICIIFGLVFPISAHAEFIGYNDSYNTYFKTGPAALQSWAAHLGGSPVNIRMEMLLDIDGVPYPRWSAELTNLYGTMMTTPLCGGFESYSGVAYPPCKAFTTLPIMVDSGECIRSGDPIGVCTGNLSETKVDYQSAGKHSLSFVRTYNSLAYPTSRLGVGWRHSYDRSLTIEPDRVRAFRDTGQMLTYTKDGGNWVGVADIRLKLAQTGSGFTLTDDDRTVETYNSAGLLTSIAWSDGYTQTIDNVSGRLAGVSDTLGRSLTLTYNGDGLLATMTAAGRTYNYAYEKTSPDTPDPLYANSLSTVTYPNTGSSSPAIHYNYGYTTASGLSLPSILSSITDELGHTIARWTFNDDGQALSSKGANDTNITTLSYDPANLTTVVTSPLGETITYQFGQAGSMYKAFSEARAASGTIPAATRSYTYDGKGFLASRTDWNGNLTTYVNNDRGLVEKRTEAANDASLKREINTVWHPTYALPTKITEPGLVTDFTYDAYGNVVTKKETDTTVSPQVSRTWTYTYTTTSPYLLASVTGPRTDAGCVSGGVSSCKTTYAYTGTAKNLSTVTNALGQVTTFTSYDASGRPTAFTDANGTASTLTYDPLGRPLSIATGGATTTIAYDAAGLVSTVTQPDGVVLTYGWDDAQRLTSITGQNGDHLDFVLDNAGNITQETVSTGGGSLRFKASHTYDTFSRLLKDIGYLSAQNTTYGYDSNGNRTSSKDARNYTTTQGFDALNRLVTVTDPLAAVATTSYDGQDNVTGQTDFRNRTTSYTYNGFGQLIQSKAPQATQPTIYTLDKAGNRISETDPRGIVTNRTFDKLDRVLTETFPASASENIAYSYDATASGNKGKGRLTGFTDESGSTALTYDARGNVTQSVQTILGKSYTTSWTYNLADKPTLITYPSGRQMQLVYSVYQDSLTAINTRPNGTASWTALAGSILREPWGPVKSFTYGNGLLHYRIYNNNYLPVSIQTKNGGTFLQNLSFTYDNALNVTAIADGVTASRNQTFTLDALNRLDTASGAYGSLDYGYEANSNRTSEVSSGSTKNYVLPNSSDRLSRIDVSGSPVRSFGYQADGTITFDDRGTSPDLSYGYSNRNRMKQVTSAGTTLGSYRYTAQGERASKTTPSGTTHYLYDLNGRLIAEADGTTGATIREYAWLPDEDGIDLPLAQIDSSGTYAILSDQLGTPQKLADATKAIVWDRVQKPFGETHSTTGTASTNLRFPGQYADAETGLHYNFFRDYDPTLGRYVQPDPIGQEAGLNYYGYAKQQPVYMFDSLGLCSPSDISCQMAMRQAGLNKDYAEPGVGKHPWRSVGLLAGVAALPVAASEVAVGSSVAAFCPIESSSVVAGSGRLTRLADDIAQLLGPNFKRYTNRSGDLRFRSADNRRQIRFDLKDFHSDPDGPHINLEEFSPRNSHPDDSRMIKTGNIHIYPKAP